MGVFYLVQFRRGSLFWFVQVLLIGGGCQSNATPIDFTRYLTHCSEVMIYVQKGKLQFFFKKKTSLFFFQFCRQKCKWLGKNYGSRKIWLPYFGVKIQSYGWIFWASIKNSKIHNLGWFYSEKLLNFGIVYTLRPFMLEGQFQPHFSKFEFKRCNVTHGCIVIQTSQLFLALQTFSQKSRSLMIAESYRCFHTQSIASMKWIIGDFCTLIRVVQNHPEKVSFQTGEKILISENSQFSFTISMSHFSQNSQIQCLTFDKNSHFLNIDHFWVKSWVFP